MFNVTLYATRDKEPGEPVIAAGADASGQPRELRFERSRPNWAQLLEDKQREAHDFGRTFCVFVCGPGRMVDDLSDITRERGIAFHAETFEF